MSYGAVYEKTVDAKKHGKLQNLMRETEEMIQSFDISKNDPKALQEQVTKIRGKVKLVAIHMGMKYSVEQE